MRIRRKVNQDSNLTLEGIISQLVVSPKEIEAGSRREIHLEREQALRPNDDVWPEGEEAFSEVTRGI